MKKYSICYRENLNLVTVKNIDTYLGRIISFLEDNDISIISCNIKPSKLFDILIVAPDKSLSKIASVLKSKTTQNNVITIRSGVCIVSIVPENNSPINIVSIICRYFDKKDKSIERIIVSQKEIRIFFPASEVCGSLDAFLRDFENYINNI